jgi:hypothetical protein
MTRNMRRFVKIVAAGIALGASAAQAQDPAAVSGVVYENALGAGWENKSSATVELGIELAGSPRRPIKVEAGPAQALELQHAAFPVTKFKNLSFIIQGTQPDLQVQVVAVVNGQPAGEGRVVKFSNTGWTRVVSPVKMIAEDNPTIDGIVVRNIGEQPLPAFVITDIKFE